MDTVLVHLHPDFTEELLSLFEKWNQVQNQLFFKGVTPVKEYEAQLLSPGAINDETTFELANNIREKNGNTRSDVIMIFTEKRLFAGKYYQLFFSGRGNITTISLDFPRKLFREKKDFRGYLFRAIIHNILNSLCQKAGLGTHDKTRGCILDFCNEMPDIIRGIEGGPKFCKEHFTELNKRGFNYLEELVNAVAETTDIAKQDEIVSEKILSFDKPVDIGILIALEEEFREFFSFIKGREKPILIEDINQYYYLFDYNNNNTSYRCVVTFMGGMGPELAALAGDRLIHKFKPAAIVNIGIAGSTDKDVYLGDIVVAEQTDNYLHSAKAIDNEDLFTFNFELSGDPYKTSPQYLNHVRHLRYAYPVDFDNWVCGCVNTKIDLLNEDDSSLLVEKDILREKPELHTGHIASGSIVGASKYFKKWLLDKRDRKYLAIEMESSGVLCAAYTRAIHTLVIRGISDTGNEMKAELDQIDKGAVRRYAMINATKFLWILLDLNFLERSTYR